MRRVSRLLAAVPLALAGTVVPGGPGLALTVVSQERSVFAEGRIELDASGGSPATDAGAAAAFGPYQDTAEAVAMQDPFGFGGGSATQDTVALEMPAAILASGSGAVTVGFDILDPGADSSAGATSASLFEVVFTLDEPAELALQTSLSAEVVDLVVFNGPGPAEALLSAFMDLSGDAGSIRSLSLLERELGEEASAELTTVENLPAGSYTLVVGAEADIFGFEDALGSGVARYEFELRVPAPEPGQLAGLGVALPALLALRALARHRARVAGRSG